MHDGEVPDDEEVMDMSSNIALVTFQKELEESIGRFEEYMKSLSVPKNNAELSVSTPETKTTVTSDDESPYFSRNVDSLIDSTDRSHASSSERRKHNRTLSLTGIQSVLLSQFAEQPLEELVGEAFGVPRAEPCKRIEKRQGEDVAKHQDTFQKEDAALAQITNRLREKVSELKHKQEEHQQQLDELRQSDWLASDDDGEAEEEEASNDNKLKLDLQRFGFGSVASDAVSIENKEDKKSTKEIKEETGGPPLEFCASPSYVTKMIQEHALQFESKIIQKDATSFLSGEDRIEAMSFLVDGDTSVACSDLTYPSSISRKDVCYTSTGAADTIFSSPQSDYRRMRENARLAQDRLKEELAKLGLRPSKANEVYEKHVEATDEAPSLKKAYHPWSKDIAQTYGRLASNSCDASEVSSVVLNQDSERIAEEKKEEHTGVSSFGQKDNSEQENLVEPTLDETNSSMNVSHDSCIWLDQENKLKKYQTIEDRCEIQMALSDESNHSGEVHLISSPVTLLDDQNQEYQGISEPSKASTADRKGNIFSSLRIVAATSEGEDDKTYAKVNHTPSNDKVSRSFGTLSDFGSGKSNNVSFESDCWSIEHSVDDARAVLGEEANQREDFSTERCSDKPLDPKVVKWMSDGDLQKRSSKQAVSPLSTGSGAKSKRTSQKDIICEFPSETKSISGGIALVETSDEIEAQRFQRDGFLVIEDSFDSKITLLKLYDERVESIAEAPKRKVSQCTKRRHFIIFLILVMGVTAFFLGIFLSPNNPFTSNARKNTAPAPAPAQPKGSGQFFDFSGVTPVPTFRLVPTPAPVFANSPISSPVAAPILVTNTSSSTPSPTQTNCTNSIESIQSCYPDWSNISISFLNCHPLVGDWIGIYNISADPQDLQQPLLWIWTCGAQSCLGAAYSETVVFEEPIETGFYKAYLVHRNPGGPYSAYAASRMFRVAANNTAC